MGKLHNAAFEIFRREYNVEHSEAYSKFEDVVYHLDGLGKNLLLDGYYSATESERAEKLETDIHSVILALARLANQKNVNMGNILLKILSMATVSMGS